MQSQHIADIYHHPHRHLDPGHDGQRHLHFTVRVEPGRCLQEEMMFEAKVDTT